MLFRDLCFSNKDWEGITELVVVSRDSSEAVVVRAREASYIFGDRQVLWFKDCVVMLL